RQALAVAQGNLTRAAELLGVSRPTLYDLLEKHGLDAAQYSRNAAPEAQAAPQAPPAQPRPKPTEE
ncbi:MAG: helix-turn-helix domain-containing protein, partial [Steroidobacteraceae bacterium]